jgi:hypothetical protein
VILDRVQKGISEQAVNNYIAQRNAAAGGHNFVYQRRSRKNG